MLTFLLEDNRDHIWVVVGDGHVKGRLHSDALIVRQSLLGLQVGVSPLLEQLCSQARQATAACGMKRALTLTGKEMIFILIVK